MNSIKEESTFFISIDKKNIKNKNNNLKNIKSNYFCKSIKSIKNNQGKKHKSSASFQNNKTLKKQFNKTQPISNEKGQINNNSRIISIKNDNQKINKSNSFILPKKNDNDCNDKIDTEENIDIEDADEYNNIKFNINKPKLPFYNRNNMISNHLKNSMSSNFSRNIINDCQNKTSIKNNNSQIIMKIIIINVKKFIIIFIIIIIILIIILQIALIQFRPKIQNLKKVLNIVMNYIIKE